MTDKELIERLGNIRLEGTQELCWNAAVRIVVLLKDKDELQDKLAKAVEALRWYANPEIYASSRHGIAFDRPDKSWRADAILTELGAKP